MKRWSLLLIILAAVSLGACSSSSDADQEGEKIKKEEEAKAAVAPKKSLPICPQVAIVRELDDIKDYGNEKPSLDQLVGEARMDSVQGNCGYIEEKDDNDKKTGKIDIAFDLKLTAARGPRMGSTHGSFPFFVALIDPEQKIITKDKMIADFTFSDSKDNITADKVESLHIILPLEREKWDTGPNYQVLLGFQLTQEQIDAVRSQKKLPQ